MIQPPLLIAQITDTHLFADFQQDLLGMPTTDSLQALLKHLAGLSPQPDLLLLTGDLSQDGTPGSYDRLQTLLAPLGIPVYWLPGNHDADLEEMARSLTHPLFFLDRSFAAGGWRFVLLDSQEAGLCTWITLVQRVEPTGSRSQSAFRSAHDRRAASSSLSNAL